MSSQYKKSEKVNVYATQSAKDTGAISATFSTKPISYAGCDYYRYKGAIYPGYIDREDRGADACIILGAEQK